LYRDDRGMTDAVAPKVLVEGADLERIDFGERHSAEDAPNVVIEPSRPESNSFLVKSLRPVVFGQPVKPAGESECLLFLSTLHLCAVSEGLEEFLGFGLVWEDPGDALIAIELVNVAELDAPLAGEFPREDLLTRTVLVVCSLRDENSLRKTIERPNECQ